MNPMPELSPLLKQLRLSGILETLPARNREAIEKKLSYTEFLVHHGANSTPVLRNQRLSFVGPFEGFCHGAIEIIDKI